ncbi:hypothetical protein K505DRAFT_378735 [Melanomma pulvis-pyrius CBS 109.77]|uniref:Nuclear pore complex protein Nup85 n=1 Tax=Melanomma pulvis-pyrius CBS 109.77 TaxID=1314802 RepID=A0A6A6WXP9_9PLEO|nr:hypothetical protein K505DRAFT_378735 [Melanomma pulvis-pyrius CBS 109.77]
MFRVPSSSPPSTPDSRRSSRNFNNAPSTTPAGPPPDISFIPSSTPAGPPPATGGLFGTSQPNFGNPRTLNFQRSAFGSSPPKNELFGVGSGSIKASTSGRPTTQRGRTGSGFRVPTSSPPQALHADLEEEDDSETGSEEEDESMDSDEDAEAEDDDDDDEMDEDEEEAEDDDDYGSHARGPPRSQNSLAQSTSRNSITEPPSSPLVVRPEAKQSQYDLLDLAKGLAPNNERAILRESDQVIMETERIAEKLHDSMASNAPEKRSDVLGEVAQELVALWKDPHQLPEPNHPGKASTVTHAARLASLLLNIHYPPHVSQNQRTSTYSLVPTRPDSRHFTPIPKVLLDWMNNYHRSISEVDLVLKETRGYSAHTHFWDAVQASVFWGDFSKTLKLLKGARFEVAETAQHDELGNTGYSGSHLRHTNEVVRIVINLIEECPAIASQDWDIKGHDWEIFRKRIRRAYEDLQEFAEGDSQNRQSVSQPFQASHFGISQSQNSFNMSTASRKAESNVPWSVYENLTRLYKQLYGSEEEIIAVATDWVEAVVGLAIWWNGDEEEVAQGSLAASRRSIARSQRVRTVDITPVKAYCQRLSSALATVFESNEADFSLDCTSRAEVGLACIFDDNIEGVLQILRNWSLVVASVVAEVASSGEWLMRADGILDQFDQSDLMVFNYTEPKRTGISKDSLLTDYSNLLARKGQLTSRDGKTVREGWELAIHALGRLDDVVAANEKIEQILNELPLQSSDRVDKITQLCHSMDLSKHALGIALKYANHLRNNTENYGDTLLYYARAHDANKIQEVLRVLVAHCLVKSIAYPPPAELDDSLSALITSPKQTLTKLASQDPEGAQLLSNYLSGYATIRKFYDLRDEEILVQDGEKPAHRPMARKRAAANALMVIIASAASSIRGGLYDPEIETVVQVDVLLPLLGEALVFVNQPKRTLALRHLYALLAAVEDLDTAPSMIRSQCEECLSTALSAAHDSNSRIPSPHSLLQKSTSNLTTASSQYSIIGSAEFGSVEGVSTENSGVLIRGGNVDDAKRGWDWRKGMGKDATGSDVVRVLRLGIAREMARAFAEGEA